MLTEISFFGASFAFGFFCGLIDLAVRALFVRLKNRAALVTSQFFLGGICVAGLTIIALWLNDGQFTLYSVISLVVGFFACKILTKKSA